MEKTKRKGNPQKANQRLILISACLFLLCYGYGVLGVLFLPGYWIYLLLPLIWIIYLIWHILKYGWQRWMFLLFFLWLAGSFFVVGRILVWCLPIIESVSFTPFRQIVGYNYNACV
jgi:hypothetical protein